MHRVGLVVVVLAPLLVVPSTVLAQGSGSSGAPSFSNFQTSRTVEGRIVEIDAREGYLILEFKDDYYRIALEEDTKLKADKKTGLHKNELTWEDFAVGSRVKLTIRTSDGHLLEARLREISPGG